MLGAPPDSTISRRYASDISGLSFNTGSGLILTRLLSFLAFYKRWYACSPLINWSELRSMSKALARTSSIFLLMIYSRAFCSAEIAFISCKWRGRTNDFAVPFPRSQTARLLRSLSLTSVKRLATPSMASVYGVLVIFLGSGRSCCGSSG